MTDGTNQRTKKPATNDNTIADTPTFVEIAPLLVEVGVATIVVLPTLIVAAVLPPTIVTLPTAIETSVLPATIVAVYVVDPLSLLLVVVAEAAAELELELAAVERSPLNEVPTTIVVLPKLIVFAPSANDEGIEIILVVVGTDVAVRVVLAID